MEALIQAEHEGAECEAARLMQWTRSILCGPKDAEPGFCLPEAAATRTINESPDVFLALLYWRRNGGEVEIGSEEHRRLLGLFTALSWFQPGNARARQESLREWVAAAGLDVAGRMWLAGSVRFFFTRKELAVPAFPPPDSFSAILLKGVLEVVPYDYDNLAASAPASFWEDYTFLPTTGDETDEMRKQWLEGNLMSFLNRLWPCRTMLLYAQRSYIRKRFKAFGQWELTLKDTHCPWDWDHIYPSASGLHNVDKVYKDWHHTIGNLRAAGLSENRGAGCNAPTEKLGQMDADGTPRWQNSFISDDLWKTIQSLGYQPKAIKDNAPARKICDIVLRRMIEIYREWYEQMRIGAWMGEIRDLVNVSPNRSTSH